MASCGTCAAGNTSISDNSVTWTNGTFTGGAKMIFRNVVRTLAVSGFKVPNIIQFSELPNLQTGDALFLTNQEIVTSIRNINPNVLVTGAPVLVGGLYEVPTDLAMTGVGGATVATLVVTIGSQYCATGSVAKSVTADVLATGANLSDFNGYVYGRPLNSSSVSGCVYVANGSTKITIKDAGLNIRKGDKITLDQTAILGANAATVIDVSTGRNSDGDRVVTVELDRTVTGITATALPGQLPQVTATARPQIFAPLTFTSGGAYEIVANLPAAVTSSPNFPSGTRVEATDSTCEGQAYCYVMNVKFPSNTTTSVYGTLVLR